MPPAIRIETDEDRDDDPQEFFLRDGSEELLADNFNRD
jgi:hypothetical protein